MDAQQVQLWINLAGAFVALGIDSVKAIKLIFASEGRSDDELNAVLKALQLEGGDKRDESARIAAGEQ